MTIDAAFATSRRGFGTARLTAAARRIPLPEGTWAIGAGLLIIGVTTYAFQVLAARRLSNSDYAALNVLWAIVFVVTPGLFLPLEQEVARALARRRACGAGGAPIVRRAAVLGAALAGVVLLGAAVFAEPIVNELFNGNTGLLVALFVAVAFYYVAHLARGTLAGNARFGPYGLLHGAEGTARFTLCFALFAIGATAAGLYGLALAIPPILAVLIALRGQRGMLEPGPAARYTELSSALGLLLVASLLAQLLSYAPVLAAQLLAAPSQKDLVAKFVTGFFVARISLLLFQAVQAALLPKLSRLAGEGRHDDFRRGLRQLLLILIALCAAGTVAAAVIGPSLGRMLFPTKWILGSRDLMLLTLGSSLLLIALTLAQGLIALQAYARALFAWVLGVLVFVLTLAVVHDLFLRTELAFVAGCAVAAFVMAIALAVRMRDARPDLDDLVEVLEHEPVEV